MAGFVFHVQFGMNETVLTQALEAEKWSLAENFILDCQNSSYLDEGCYQRVPLYICLCGSDEYGTKSIAYNLYLVRLLVERGADVNLRIPLTNFGSEYVSPGKSSLELLVEFYIYLSQHCKPGGTSQLLSGFPLPLRVIGLNKSYLTLVQDVLDDLQDLIFIILRHGGDASVIDELRVTPTHRAVTCRDASLIRLLSDNGASLSVVDIHGNTPLLTLCLYEGHLNDLDHKGAESTQPGVNLDILQFLLKNEEVDVNHQNKQGQTCLFHLLLRGDKCGARLALQAGADPGLAGQVWESRRRKRKLSPLLASLLANPVVPQGGSRLYRPGNPVSQCRAALVDDGYFNTESVHQDLVSLVTTDYPEFSHLCQSGFVSQMFGSVSASLKQLATRCVFQNFLLSPPTNVDKKELVAVIADNSPDVDVPTDSLSQPHAAINQQIQSDIQHNIQPNTDSHTDAMSQHKSTFLNQPHLRQSLSNLELPASLLSNFEVELLYTKLTERFQTAEAVRPSCEPVSCLPVGQWNNVDSESDGSDTGDTGGSSSSEEDVENDSDLEYW